jgi:hypothetical protein
MMARLLNVVAMFSVAMAIVVLASLRRAHIRVEYSVSWLAAAAALFLVSRWSGGLQEIADLIGAPNAAFALLIMVLCVFLVVFYRFSVVVSNLKDANIALAQKVAILEYRIQTLNEGRQESQTGSSPIQ